MKHKDKIKALFTFDEIDKIGDGLFLLLEDNEGKEMPKDADLKMLYNLFVDLYVELYVELKDETET